MASKNTSNQTCENENDNQWPRFLIMEAADEKVPLNLNAFVLKKAIDRMANAELDNVKPMKSGRVFIEVETRQQCKNLLKTTKLLGYLPVKVSPHRTLNSSKFVIKCEELDKMEEDEIKKELQPQGIFAVKRISIRYSLYVLTIKGQTVPKRINIGYLKKETRPYIPNPQRCFQCQKFGHTKNSCKGKAVCAGCGEEGHNLDDCKNDPKCVNCQGDHVAISRDCPKWKIEKDIVTLKYTEKISFANARKRLQPSFDPSKDSYATVTQTPPQSSRPLPPWAKKIRLPIDFRTEIDYLKYILNYCLTRLDTLDEITPENPVPRVAPSSDETPPPPQTGDGGGRPSSVMSLGVTSVGGHSHGHPASPIGVGSSWEDIDPRSPEPWLSEGVGSGWSGLYGGPLRPYTCEPYPTQLVCRELRPEGLVAWCPGMLRYGWQVHNMAHKSPGSIYILWPRPTW